VSEAWTVVVAIGVGTMLIKAAGPVLLGARPLPGPVQAVIPLLAPALLAALVATATLDGGDQRLVLDARLIGLGAAAVALLVRAPVLAVVIVAAAAAAFARLAGIG
jgi:branched-subunit amino acid transport protein